MYTSLCTRVCSPLGLSALETSYIDEETESPMQPEGSVPHAVRTDRNSHLRLKPTLLMPPKSEHERYER